MAGTESCHLESYRRARVLQLFTLVVTKLVTQQYLSKAFAHPSGAIFFFNFCIKFGESVTLAEVHTLRFITEHTSIPVPRRSLSNMSKASIFNQLKQMVEEPRSIPSESGAVSNLEGGPIHDCRLPQTSSSPSPAISDIQNIIAFHESVLRPPVLTHGDLSSFNVLLRDDKVVGIVDWATTGWLPYYWKYTIAWHVNPQNLFWQKEVQNFLDPYEEELRNEKLWRTYFGEI
ncbi:hypothetical protein BKA65DRAFT_610569 [Rhexocercosporidium sp. MPI-PUGE-AT-0058]|nr:hypothetical protein BKA65DRAFT_610569 [Rhexocercosporidium sp. MPI-PUGE-AT-0058]